MKHQQIRSQIGQNITEMIAQEGNLPVTLRPYQRETLEATAEWLQNPKGTKRAYVSHATGLGKTILFASIIVAASCQRALIIVPTKTLLEQTARVVARFTGGMLGHLSSLVNIENRDGDIVAVRGMDHSAVLLTTDSSFRKYSDRIKKEFDPHLILRDECHWSYVESALNGLKKFKEAVIIGFSATPDYLTSVAKGGYLPVTLENGRMLYGSRDRFADTHYQTRLNHRPIRWGIENGWLAAMAWGQIEFDVELAKYIPIVDTPHGADYNDQDLQKIMHKHWPVMCETITRLYANSEYDLPNRQAYAVCPSVKAANELAEAINAFGIPAACITGNTPDTERNILLQAFDEKQIRLLTSVMVLREGWDAPGAEVCMMLRPTKSRTLYEQVIGRALRIPEDGEYKVALILDAHFLRSKLHPLSAPLLYAKPGEEIAHGDIFIDRSGWEKRKADSPYLPKKAQPKIIVVPALGTHIEYWPGKDGAFEADGETWVMLRVAEDRLGVRRHNLRDRIKAAKKPVRTKNIPNHNGTFYVLNDLRDLCKDLFRSLPKAGKDGSITHQGEIWMVKLKAAKKLGVSTDTVERKIVAGGIRNIEGYPTNAGKPKPFYSYRDLEAACNKLTSNLMQADSSGTLTIDQRVWATIPVIADIFDLVEETVRAQLRKKDDIAKLEGKDVSGQIADFFPLEEASEACSDLLKDVPRADKDGIFHFDGEVWATASHCRRLMGLKHNTPVLLRIARSGMRFREGRIGKGSIEKLYPLERVRAVCSDLFPGAVPVSRNGVFSDSDGQWASTSALSDLLSVSKDTAKLITCSPKVRTRQGREGRSRPLPYHSVEDAKRVLKDGVNLPTTRKKKRKSRS